MSIVKKIGIKCRKKEFFNKIVFASAPFVLAEKEGKLPCGGFDFAKAAGPGCYSSEAAAVSVQSPEIRMFCCPIRRLLYGAAGHASRACRRCRFLFREAATERIMPFRFFIV